MIRPNLKVITGELAHKIIIQNQRAIGISYAQNDQRNGVPASKEMLLCRGAINSPQLVMLSDLGPAEQLSKLSIKPLTDL